MKTVHGKLQQRPGHLTTMNAIADALYSFADTLQVSCSCELW